MMNATRFFVEHWAYFGEVGREEFQSWHDTEVFLNQLRPGAMLNFGFAEEVIPPAAKQLSSAGLQNRLRLERGRVAC